jgi:molybdopterin converting factor small subunit
VSGNKPFPANTLVAVNMEYADRNRAVGRDEVVFFPPVTGG